MPDIVGDPLQIIRVGRVATVNLALATCTVEIGDPLDGGFETDDIQWLAQRAGDTICWSPPTVGEQGLLLCPDGDVAQAVFVPGLFSTAFPAPASTLREFTRYADDAEFGYDPEGHHSDETLPAGGTTTVHSTGGVLVDADENFTVNADGGATLNAAAGAIINADQGMAINVATGGLDIDGNQRTTGMIDALLEITSQVDVWFKRIFSLRRHSHCAPAGPYDGTNCAPPPPEEPEP